MSNLGVFAWIREGVRRSVLLGFSDAVEQLGASADSDEAIHPQLASVLLQSSPAALGQPAERPANKPDRKRLGRSLDQLRNQAPLAGGGNA
jgi:hypothetical protein